MVAADDLVALGTHQEIGKPPAVEEKDDLFPIFEAFVYGGFQAPGKEIEVFIFRHFPCHVYEFDGREGGSPDPRGKRKERDFSVSRVLIGFQRRGGAAKYCHGFKGFRPHERDIPGMVPGRLVLFVSVFVFLIHDNQAQVWKGRENSGTGAHKALYFTLFDGAPHIVFLSERQLAVIDSDPIPEAAAEAFQCLRGKGDFRNENNSLPSIFKNPVQCLEINLGFSASGNAVQEKCGVSVLFDGVLNMFKG
jgi:hypothetical protein